MRMSSARTRTLCARTHPVAPFGRSGSSTRYHEGRHALVRRIAVTAKTVGTWFTFRRPNRRTADPPGLLKTTARERTRATSERPFPVVAVTAPVSQRGGACFAAAGGGGACAGSAFGECFVTPQPAASSAAAIRPSRGDRLVGSP